MIRVAFILESETGESARHRVLDAMDAFEREGIDVYPMVLPRSGRGRSRLYRDVRGYDVVVLQRRLLPPWEFARLRGSVRALGYDFDEAPLCGDRPLCAVRSLWRSARFRLIVKGVDFVTAASARLARLSRRRASEVFVVPTPIDTQRYAPAERREGPARLGWIGSAKTLAGLEAILPEVERVVASRPGVTLTAVSDEFGGRRDWIREVVRSEDTEAAEAAAFDIGLMPSGDCGWPLLVYGACGAASVASPSGAASDIVSDGETGILAAGPGDWEQAIRALVDDPARRREMGRAARRRVEAGFSRAAVIGAWADALKRMARDRGGQSHPRPGESP